MFLRWYNEKMKQHEDGMAAIEGLFILTFMLFFLMFLLSIGFLLYQQWHVTLIANDTATRIAQSYAYPNTDPVMGYVDGSMKASMSPFRYLTGRLERKNMIKGTKYADWSLDQLSFAYETGNPQIEIKTVFDDFAQRHVVVNITAEYEIPFGSVLEIFGMEKTVTYHGSGRAMVTDLSDMVYSCNTMKTLTSETLGSTIVKAVDKVGGLIHSIMDALED